MGGSKPGPISHGTQSGYQTHLHRGVPVCVPCRAAARAQGARARQAARERGTCYSCGAPADWQQRSVAQEKRIAELEGK